MLQMVLQVNQDLLLKSQNLKVLYDVSKVSRRNLLGDIVECGVWLLTDSFTSGRDERYLVLSARCGATQASPSSSRQAAGCAQKCFYDIQRERNE
jgi:hypothetical protein